MFYEAIELYENGMIFPRWWTPTGNFFAFNLFKEKLNNFGSR